MRSTPMPQSDLSEPNLVELSRGQHNLINAAVIHYALQQASQRGPSELLDMHRIVYNSSFAPTILEPVSSKLKHSTQSKHETSKSSSYMSPSQINLRQMSWRTTRCRHFTKRSWCPAGDQCMFVHDLTLEAHAVDVRPPSSGINPAPGTAHCWAYVQGYCHVTNCAYLHPLEREYFVPHTPCRSFFNCKKGSSCLFRHRDPNIGRPVPNIRDAFTTQMPTVPPSLRAAPLATDSISQEASYNYNPLLLPSAIYRHPQKFKQQSEPFNARPECANVVSKPQLSYAQESTLSELEDNLLSRLYEASPSFKFGTSSSSQYSSSFPSTPEEPVFSQAQIQRPPYTHARRYSVALLNGGEQEQLPEINAQYGRRESWIGDSRRDSRSKWASSALSSSQVNLSESLSQNILTDAYVRSQRAYTGTRRDV